MVHGRARTRFHGLTALALAAIPPLLACKDADPAPPTARVSLDAERPAAPPAPTSAPPAAPRSLACLGDELPIMLSGGLPYAKVTVGDPKYTVDFLVDYATNVSTIDLSKFPTPGPSPTGCDPTRLGQTCSFSSFELFGPWGEVSLRTTSHGDGPGVAQAGILGTDFTSLVAITLDYAGSKVRRARKPSFCTEGELGGAGFSPLSSAGFFTNDPSKLRPLSDVIEGSSPTYSVANVPTVPLRIAGVVAQTQLDTGFEDSLVPRSINVNEAFLAEVIAKDASALVRAADKDLSLSTCAGVSEHVEAYTLRSGVAADFVAENGTPASSFPGATVFVKRTPPAARKCGGIGSWTVPAAQVGASFFAALGVVVFDPFGSRVWVR